MQYGFVDIECMHLLCHFLDNNEESFDDIIKYLQLGLSHVMQSSLLVQNLELYHNMVKLLSECLSPVEKLLPYTMQYVFIDGFTMPFSKQKGGILW